jgi:hypothetical protein
MRIRKGIIRITIFAIFTALSQGGVPAVGETSLNLLNYYSSLMEYYAGYCDNIGPKEFEEAYLLMYPGKYASNARDDREKKKDLRDVSAKLDKIISMVQKGAHKYDVLTRAAIGAYNEEERGYTCDIIQPGSCLDLSPVEKGHGSTLSENDQAIIGKGVLFGKIRKIKLFFLNAPDYGIMYSPKKDINIKEAYAIVHIEILPKKQCQAEWEKINRYIYVPGVENNYYMIAQIDGVELYGEPDLKNKIGSVGNTLKTLDIGGGK